LLRRYLCLENVGGANTVLQLYSKGCGEKLDSPLLHFVQFLLKTVERDAAPLFSMLRTKYAVSIARDPNLEQYLNKIGEVYFDIKAPQGMLATLTGMLG